MNIKIEYGEDTTYTVWYTGDTSAHYEIHLDYDGSLYARWMGDVNETTFGIVHQTTLAWSAPQHLQGYAANRLLDAIAEIAAELCDLWVVGWSDYHQHDVGSFSDPVAADALIVAITRTIEEYAGDPSNCVDIIPWEDWFTNDETPEYIYHYMCDDQGLVDYPGDSPVLVTGSPEHAAHYRLWSLIDSVDTATADAARVDISRVHQYYVRDEHLDAFWDSFAPSLIKSEFGENLHADKRGVWYGDSLILPRGDDE